MKKNVPISKKLWNIVRFVLYMLQKGISKQKLLANFNATLKRGKNLMLNSRHRVPATSTASLPPKEYEFSCSGTPNYSFPFNMAAFKKKSHHNSLFACGQDPPTHDDDISATRAVMELLKGVGDHGQGRNSPALSVEAMTALSPYFPGFARSSALVRPLRVTDSPFPIREDDDVTNGLVDEAADEFIKKFYENLNKQKKMIESSPN